ncbi:MAG: hypothetical protein ACR2LS_00210 [Thermomicrobiales bacterium]
MSVLAEPHLENVDGSSAQQKLAARVLEVLRLQARFLSSDAAIRVPVDALAEFMSGIGSAVSVKQLTNMVEKNPGVFTLEQVDGTALIVTTRAGHTHQPPRADDRHDFKTRFLTPEPKPETPAPPRRERARMDPSWADIADVLENMPTDEEEEADLLAAWEAQEAAARAAADRDEAIAEQSAEAEPSEPSEPPAAANVVEPIRVPAIEAVAAEPASETAPEPPPAIPAPAGARGDFAAVSDDDLAAAITGQLSTDSRAANFGNLWMPEDRVPRFSRGDLRRLKDYIQEQDQPLVDSMLVQDILGVRPGTPDFDVMRFAVNFRLSREHREFDFVGTNDQRFWSTSSLPQIGTTRRKPNEIGTDYRFLLDEMPAQPAHRSVESIDHVVTFYEYYHGLLPYDASMQLLLPPPLLADQKSAVLTFEMPQSYTTYLVDVRYPSPNRGGFILGLDDFYAENLVPGALISITATENDGHYRVEYMSSDSENARLLELDERRAARYVFRPTSYACGVEPSALLTEERFPRLASAKPLEDRIRRRPESVLAETFERIGDQQEAPGFSATLSDLMAAANIERPFSERLIRSTLENDETGAFARDSEGTDVYTYVPSNSR